MKPHYHQSIQATQLSPHWSTAAGQEGSLGPSCSPWYPPLPAAQSKGEKIVHNCPTTTLQGSTLMRTRGNLYFKDVITPNQKIIFALMLQSSVLSVIHVHCLYPAQFRKHRAVAISETPRQHLLPGLTATRVTTTIQ